MSEVIRADPHRLAEFSADMAPLVPPVRDALDRYGAALATLRTAGVDHLGACPADASPRLHALLDRLQELGQVPGRFGQALAVADALPPGLVVGDRHLLDLQFSARVGPPGSPGPDPVGWLGDQAWFAVPWTLGGATDTAFDAHRTLVLAPRLQRALDLHRGRVEAVEHLPEHVRLSAWLRWQQEVSGTVGLDRALAVAPGAEDYRVALHRSGQLASGWRVPTWARSGGRILGRVAIPLGAAFDLHTLAAPESSRVDRGLAAAGLGAAGIAGGVALGIVSSPVIIGAGVVAGVAAAGYGVHQLWVDHGDAVVRWAGDTWDGFTDGVGATWGWTTERAGAGWDWTTERAGATWEQATEAVGTATEWTGDRVDDAADALGTATDWTGDRLGDATDAVGSALSAAGDVGSNAWDSVSSRFGW